MTLDEAIIRYTSNAEYERSHGSLQGCLDFRQLADWLTELKEYKAEQNHIDKIRAEIQHEADNHADAVEMKAYYQCLHIINKYR